MILEILGTAVVAGVVGFLTWERYDMAKALVWAELRGMRATDIRIRPDWFDFDGDTLTFDVEYTAADGSRQWDSCKVATRSGADQRVFWPRERSR